ncbi:hypothetical protein SOVF_039150 [Spinacia oleracea]|nr:hypothetical protein SOVF_039150 [Spinacia oleracea]
MTKTGNTLNHGTLVALNIHALTVGAIVWFEERVKNDSNKTISKYGICCQKGKIVLPLLKDQARMLNSIFAFTSMGGKVDSTINRGSSPYVFRLNGQNHHRIGSLLPPAGEQPRFTQLYIYDTQNEVANRISSIASNGGNQNWIQKLSKIGVSGYCGSRRDIESGEIQFGIVEKNHVSFKVVPVFRKYCNKFFWTDRFLAVCGFQLMYFLPLHIIIS